VSFRCTWYRDASGRALIAPTPGVIVLACYTYIRSQMPGKEVNPSGEQEGVIEQQGE
jgi:hypothetical protein